ncbi:MAG: hypothetical protein ABSB80_08660 [Methanoregula sp.]|uniref:hypothetical protein n=1 Tax=Methanoregula sp. TaxID=2052170 RepID=UPI003D0F4A59
MKQDVEAEERKETYTEKTMIFLTWVVTVAGVASIGIQIVALPTPRQILEGLSFELFFILSVIVVYARIFERWPFQETRKQKREKK